MTARALLLLFLLVSPLAARAQDAPTFHRDVEPILQRRCQACHRPGAVGPFSLLTLEDAVGHSAMIEEVVENRRMPPWHAAPDVGHFSNDRSLSADERSTILRWLQGDLAAGEVGDAPPPRAFPQPGTWRTGEPDAVVTTPRAIRVPALGAVEYQYFDVPTDFGEDKWVTATDVQVEAPSVVHHVLVFVRYPDPRSSPRVDGGLRGYFASLLPGDTVEPWPLGAAKLLPRGSTLRFQIHYTPDGEAHTDRVRLALRFLPSAQPVQRRARTVALFDRRFKIPAGAASHVVRAHYDFAQDALLVGLTPHMHLRGKSFQYVLKTPDGQVRRLLSIPRWDFNWQSTYRFAEPLFVPAGSRVVGIAVFDNSAQNPANPDPSRAVEFGEQTWDEMMIGYLDLIDARPEDRPAAEPAEPEGAAR